LALEPASTSSFEGLFLQRLQEIIQINVQPRPMAVRLDWTFIQIIQMSKIEVLPKVLCGLVNLLLAGEFQCRFTTFSFEHNFMLAML